MANLAPLCEIIDASSEVSGCPSSNLLDSDPSKIWLTEAGMPQWVMMSMGENVERERSVVKTFGWQCWHPYSTNPKTVKLYVSRDAKKYKLWDSFDGPQKRGIHLFILQSPLAFALYPYVSIEITESHGGERTYMNRIFFYTDEIVGSSPSHGIMPELAPLGTPAGAFGALHFGSEDASDDISTTSERSSCSDTEQDPADVLTAKRLEKALGISREGSGSPGSISLDDQSSEEKNKRTGLTPTVEAMESRLATLEDAMLSSLAVSQARSGLNPSESRGYAFEAASRRERTHDIAEDAYVGNSDGKDGEKDRIEVEEEDGDNVLRTSIASTLTLGRGSKFDLTDLRTLSQGNEIKADLESRTIQPPSPKNGQAHPYAGSQQAVRRSSLSALLPPTPRDASIGLSSEKDNTADLDLDKRLQGLENMYQGLMSAMVLMSARLDSLTALNSGEQGQPEAKPTKEHAPTAAVDAKTHELDEMVPRAQEGNKEVQDMQHMVEAAVKDAVSEFVGETSEVLRRVEDRHASFVEGLAHLAQNAATLELELDEDLHVKAEDGVDGYGVKLEDIPETLDFEAMRASCGLVGPNYEDASVLDRETNTATDSTVNTARRSKNGNKKTAKKKSKRGPQSGHSVHKSCRGSDHEDEYEHELEEVGELDQVSILAKALKAAQMKKELKEEHLRKLNYYNSLSMAEKEIRLFGEPFKGGGSAVPQQHWRY